MAPPTLHHVRHFDPSVPFVHPDQLRARGPHFKAVLVLNTVRFALETVTQAVLLESLIRDQEKSAPLSRGVKWGMRLKFWRDVIDEERRMHEESPDNPQRDTQPGPGTPSSPSYRDGRAARVRVQEAVAPPAAEAVEIPPTMREATPIDKMVEMYGQPARQQRYAFHPDKRIEDDEFEATEPPVNPEEAARLLAEHRARMLKAGVVPPPAVYEKWQRKPPQREPPPEVIGAARFPGLSGMTAPVAAPPVVVMRR